MPNSRVIPGRYPAPGSSEIADRIRERRGERGITELDAALLHVPPVADGWNSLLGAIRTKGKLPGDVREIMILRVAVVNRAAYEWIQHEPVARKYGLQTAQLRQIRRQSVSELNMQHLSSLQLAALRFADESTRSVHISPETSRALRESTEALSNGNKDEADDLYVEAAATTSTYNMVSRFLVSLDVAGVSDEPVPWPVDPLKIDVPLPNLPGRNLQVKTLIADPSLPWIIFSNSLLTNVSMWDYVLPYVLEHFNVILYDQRGHGKSSTPPEPCTIPLLAQDMASVLDHLNIKQVHAVIGVSQGGAAALSFGTQFPERTKLIVSCDTGPRTPAGNREAWQSRIELASSKGMSALADATSARWFPGGIEKDSRMAHVKEMVTTTALDGFRLGAGALMDYDLVQDGLLQCKTKVILVAGGRDGDGKVAQSMAKLAKEWQEQGGNVTAHVVPGSGHLPMIDNPAEFWLSVKGALLEV